MQNELIHKIDKVNKLNYLSNDYILSNKEYIQIIEQYKKEKNIHIDKVLEDFIIYVNGKMFFDWVVFNPVENIPFLKDNICDLGLFYSLKPEMQYYTFGTMKDISNRIEKKDFLLAEATPEDFLVLSFDEKDYGKVYYIKHEVFQGERSRFLAANSVKDLINRLFLKN